MTNPTIQADTKPTVNANQNDSAQISEAIRKAEADVETEGALAGRIEKWSWVMLIAYGVLTLAIGLVTIWSNRVNTRFRDATKRLTELQIEKNRADSERKTEVETEKVRQDAARELAFAKIELDATAAARVEYVKGHAEARVEQVRQEALRRNREVNQKLAEQQERAAKAEQVVLELRERAQSRRFWSEEIEVVIRERERPTGDVLVTYDPTVPDAANVWFDIYRTLERMGWNVDKRARDATDPLRGAEGVAIFARNLDECPSDTAFCTLLDLLKASSLKKDWYCGQDLGLAENSFRIEVMGRPPLPDNV